MSESKKILLNGRKVREVKREGEEGEETVLQCSMVVSKIKLGSVRWRARTSKANGNKKIIRNCPIYSKVLSITAKESRTELDQRGAVNGVSHMGLRPAQGSVDLLRGRRVERSAYVR